MPHLDNLRAETVSLEELGLLTCTNESDENEVLNDHSALIPHCLAPASWERPVLFFIWKGLGDQVSVWGNFVSWFSY